MIAGLRPHDVTDRHAERLRTRCHGLLRRQSRATTPDERENSASFWRIAGPALAGAWCVAYLVEIVRRAATLYGS